MKNLFLAVLIGCAAAFAAYWAEGYLSDLNSYWFGTRHTMPHYASWLLMFFTTKAALRTLIG